MLIYKKNLAIWSVCIILFLGAVLWGIYGWNRIEKLVTTELKSIEYRKKDDKKLVSTNATHELPKLEVKDGVSRDLGTVKEGTNPQVNFTIVNTGSNKARIYIEDLSKGGCTAVSHIPNLAPGESAELNLIYETLGYGERTSTRRIQIQYNNPDLSPLILSVTASILPTEPHQIPIGELLYNFFVLVDVRGEEEFTKEHISGAINVPYEELDKWSLNISRELLIYLYSEDGTESDKAARVLREKGFSECYSMVGGIQEWKQQYGDRYLISGEH